MGFGVVFLGIMGLFLWGFLIYWFIRSRRSRHEPTKQEMADERAVNKALEAEEKRR